MKQPLDPRAQHACLVVVALMLGGLSWQLAYRRLVAAYRQDLAREKTLQERLVQTQALVSGAGGADAWLARNQQRLAQLNGRFPNESQIPQLLNALVEQLHQSGDFRLANITQGNLEPALDAGKPLQIDGAQCLRLPVTVKGSGRYHAILALLDWIMNEPFPCVVSLERIQLRTESPEGPRLQVLLQLSLHVVRSPSSSGSNEPS